MKRFLAEGRVIPERVDLNIQMMGGVVKRANEENIDFQISVVRSKIFAHMQAPEDVTVPDLRNHLIYGIGEHNQLCWIL